MNTCSSVLCNAETEKSISLRTKEIKNPPNYDMDTMPEEDLLFDLADLFRLFGDSTRIKILFVLLKSEMSVNDIASMLTMTQSAISHQLRLLKANNLVKYRRDGKSLIYSLDDAHVTSILQQGIEHISE
jgi:ArsR family transcriptional regulator, lead/cadmium/zinc/bismuth-responsive transcriptional repressor